ncbi:MAG: hypothetical protein QM597_00975 [Aeromicrobium sp.]|uniref:hypothetical protein n=1 Tax=Aeromicrobium sp. TaxID=1871063 RepID=UPI0039E36B02
MSDDPRKLERAADQLEDIARRLTRVASSTQEYGSAVKPIAHGVAQVVGGSATGRDRQIAAALEGVARSVQRSATSSHQAAATATRLAGAARTQARELRQRQGREQAARRR